ncbi:MAG: hypothetical protein EOP61_08810 [Sphingomonadales bacterium]|nr:MAG: hypothetical protein EOP61_08810 [Sphingomonadales bacterium]
MNLEIYICKNARMLIRAKAALSAGAEILYESDAAEEGDDITVTPVTTGIGDAVVVGETAGKFLLVARTPLN